MSSRTRRAALAAVLVSMLTLLGGTGTATAATSTFDVSVEETLGVTTGVVTSGPIVGCTNPVVTTPLVRDRTFGEVTIFFGTKTFECDEGTVDLAFRVRLVGCAATNAGWFVVTGGSGDFAGAYGFGRLTGSYAGDNACTAGSVVDRYRGLLIL